MALKYYLDKRNDQTIPTSVLLRLAELTLKLNCFAFNGDLYSQTSGIMMGTPFGVNFACLFISHL